MTRCTASFAIPLCLVGIVCTGCDTNQQGSNSGKEAGVAGYDSSAVDYYICEICEIPDGGSRRWVPYKVSSWEGRALIGEWIDEHREAIARAEKVQWHHLSVIPGHSLCAYSKTGFSDIAIETALPDPDTLGKPKTERRWIENYPSEDLDRLLDLVKKYGELIDWSKEKVEFPEAFMSYREYEALSERDGEQEGDRPN